jgi:CRISPR/Cas system-associated exonuclease Cas4 (RecB family)
MNLDSLQTSGYISVREAKDIGTAKEPLTLETGSPEWSERLRKTQDFVATAMQAVSSGTLFPMPDASQKACEFCSFQDLCRHGSRFAVKRQTMGVV